MLCLYWIKNRIIMQENIDLTEKGEVMDLMSNYMNQYYKLSIILLILLVLYVLYNQLTKKRVKRNVKD